MKMPSQGVTRARPQSKKRRRQRLSWLDGGMSKFGEISVAPIISLPALIEELGHRPRKIFAAAKVDVGVFSNPENRLPLADAGRLLVACVEQTKCEHFGLLLGERFDLSNFGALGHLLRNSATVGDALRSLVLNLHWHDRGAVPIFTSPTPSTTLLGYSVYRRDTPGIPLIYDAAITIAYRIIQELCGPTWKAEHVQFACRKPLITRPYRKLFGAPVRFDAEVSGVIFASRYLELPIEGADPLLHRLLLGALEQEAKLKMTLGEQLHEVLQQMLLGGSYSTAAVCSMFGLNERTLRRKLAKEGKQLHDLVQQTRFELAEQLLEHTDLPVAAIAGTLGYKDPNAFSRAFRSWAGISPQQWRNCVKHDK